MQKIYIQTIAALGAQDICNDHKILHVALPKENKLLAIEPAYYELINPVKLRRMSRIHKMSLYTALDCLQKNRKQQLDAVIIGTAKGSMLDTEKFIKDLSLYNEESLNPTPFIASTYNAVNGAIALSTQATVYHQTYVNRGSSFENALFDALLFCNEYEEEAYVLLGSFEELTDEYFILKNKLDYWKKNENDHLGTIAGEGACFCMLSKAYKANTLAIINIASQVNLPSIKDHDLSFMQLTDKLNIDLGTIKILVVGINGDERYDLHYKAIMDAVDNEIAILQYKKMFGEFETVNSFGVWMLWAIQNDYELPADIWIRKPQKPILPGDHFLICNHYFDENYNIIYGELT